ncbi:AAA family ATPase [bacterium]|nr:AAA family ATPase [bacterium]
MTDFEPSRRSSKRRKVTSTDSGSAKAKTSPSTYRSIARAVSSVSRRLFNPRDGARAHNNPTNNVQDSAYGSKENSLNEQDFIGAETKKLATIYAAQSESEDELAQPGVTVMPTKSQRSSTKERDAASIVATSGEGDEDTEDCFIRTRSSGRERKRPRRFSNNQEATSSPSLSQRHQPSAKKETRNTRMTVASKRSKLGSEVELGFEDLTASARKKTGKSTPKREPRFRNLDWRDAAEDESQIRQDVGAAEHRVATPSEEMLIPQIPELSEITTADRSNLSPQPRDPRLDSVKAVVLSRLTSRTLTPLTNHHDDYMKLHSLLAATIKAGEGNSILLLGSRGVGKTCLVESVMADLATENAEDFHVVRLNGFLQTDDKLALHEIWRQLGREMRVEEDETAQVSSYADTMTSLLYLLSHPDELAETLEPDAATTCKTTKSVVFVLDEFDLFTTHPRQTLLYNLFDIAQARKAPIAVVGCTARIDVSDNLEKRVKSRFSHRWIHLAAAKSLATFEDIAKAALLLRDTDTHRIRQKIPKQIRTEWNYYIEVRYKLFLTLEGPPTH